MLIMVITWLFFTKKFHLLLKETLSVSHIFIHITRQFTHSQLFGYIWISFFKKNFTAPFYGWGSTASRLEPIQGGSLLFTTKFPEIPGAFWPQKDERLSQPWSHPVVLNTGTLDWESSTLTTRPMLLVYYPTFYLFNCLTKHFHFSFIKVSGNN